MTITTATGSNLIRKSRQLFVEGVASSVNAQNDNDLPTLSQVKGLIQGNNISKQAVRTATFTNVDIATGGLLTLSYYDFDGQVATITVNDLDRVLLHGQDNLAENGIYIASTGAWTRAADADTGSELSAGTKVLTREGDQAGSTYALLDNVTTVGTDDQIWQLVYGSSQNAIDVFYDNTFFTGTLAGNYDLYSALVLIDGELPQITTNAGAIAQNTLDITQNAQEIGVNAAGLAQEIIDRQTAVSNAINTATATAANGVSALFEDITATIPAGASVQVPLTRQLATAPHFDLFQTTGLVRESIKHAFECAVVYNGAGKVTHIKLTSTSASDTPVTVAVTYRG